MVSIPLFYHFCILHQINPFTGQFKRGVSPSFYYLPPLMIGIYIHIMERGVSPSWKGKGGEVDKQPKQ